MTIKQVLKFLETNPEAIIRQTNWFPYEGLTYDKKRNVFIDELGFEYNGISRFGATPWEVMEGDLKVPYHLM